MSAKKSSRAELITIAVIFVAAIACPLFLKTRSWVDLFITIIVNMVAAVSLRFITLTGNMSFAHGAFMGIGAYTAGMLSSLLNAPIWLTVPAGAIMALIIGVITGWPFARLKSVYFCMGTMFMGQALMLFISSWKLAGGALGLGGIESLGSILKGASEAIGLKSYQGCYYFIFIFAVISLLILYRMEHSRIGTTLIAISQSQDVATSIGINHTFYRLLAVGVACFFMGLMGGLQSHYLTSISYNTYSMNLTLWIIMYMMIGGKGKFSGPMIGAILISIVQGIANLLTSISGSSNSAGFVAFAKWLGANSAYTPFITSAVLLLVAYLLPDGLIGIVGTIKGAIQKSADKKEAKRIMKEGTDNEPA